MALFENQKHDFLLSLAILPILPHIVIIHTGNNEQCHVILTRVILQIVFVWSLSIMIHDCPAVAALSLEDHRSSFSKDAASDW